MKVRTHITSKPRDSLVLSDFRGVDFSSSPFHVGKSRATNMRNLINEYGVNHKRRGWAEIKDFKPYDSDESCAVNGIFLYNHGAHSVMLCHVGQRLYRIDRVSDSGRITDYECISDGYTLIDEKSQAFCSGGRLYIIGAGDYLVYGTWDEGESYELRRVYGDRDTYVPTTTISIDNDSNVADTARATLEQVNLLTPYRKNKLLGASLKVTDEEGIESTLPSRTWTLDSGYINADSDVTVTVETLDGEGEALTIELTNSGSDRTLLLDAEGDAAGFCDFSKGKVTLTIDTTPQVEGMDNITVCFAVGEKNRQIDGCRFGILFGTDGNTDRLFLSGNSELPNVDFFSEVDDYTYFPDRNYCAVGSDASAIMGYIRLADSTLVIFKEEYMSEPGLYYRTGSTRIEYGQDGAIDDIYGIFPVVAGAIGERLVNRHALANFGSDALMLSRNGVWGIVLGANSRTTEGYTRERSRSINERLRRNNLEGAAAIVYQNKYYLAVDGECYIADGRFTYTTSDNLDGAFNYEWWYWDNIPARVFAVVENRLYFGTSDGMLCVFDDEHTDRTYQPCCEGDIAYNTELSTVAYRSGIKVSEGDGICFEDPVFAYLQEACQITEERIAFPSELGEYLRDGLAVYLHGYEGTALDAEARYTLYGVDRGGLSYGLADADGVPIDLSTAEGESFSLVRDLSGVALYITAVDEREVGEFSLKEYKDGEPLKLCEGEYNATPQPRAVICYTKNIVAEWYSQIMDLGTNVSSKTLLRMAISCEPEMNGNISFGYETRAVSKLIGSGGFKDIQLFSFENLSFESFSFDCGYASSYTVKLNERNFNFIIVRFISESDSDCAVNDITLIYKINRSNIGVK